jgi:hypothetical protein
MQHIVQIVCMKRQNKNDVLLGGRTSGLDGTFSVAHMLLHAAVSCRKDCFISSVLLLSRPVKQKTGSQGD